MPRFYFHLCNGVEFVEDEEGVDLSGPGAAHQKAVDDLRGVMAGDLLDGDLNTASFIEIEDEQHEYIETVSFADVVRLRDEARYGSLDQTQFTAVLRQAHQPICSYGGRATSGA